MGSDFKVGDIVGRKSHGLDTMFRIERIEGRMAFLKGVFFRLAADSDLDDLELVSQDDVRQAELDEMQHYDQVGSSLFGQEMRGTDESTKDFCISGRILHVDGDNDYLEKSAKLYAHANVYATTIFVQEGKMSEKVPELVRQLRPNIVVLTGHDALEDKNLAHELAGYRSSEFFVNTVNELRKLEPSLDYLIIIAGACQSHFEALIGSGANFASSPGRINIHALDPAIIAATVALTPYEDEVDLKEALEKTVTKIAGIGGLQTKGTLRYGIKS